MAVLVRRLYDSDSCEKHCFSRIYPYNNGVSFVNGCLRAPFPDRKHKVVGYCKGLFCLEYVDNGEIILWNPSKNNEFKRLPPSGLKPPLCPYPNCNNTCTAVDVISRVCGLGFNPKYGDYKVVRFVSNFYDHYEDYDHSCIKQVEVYSLISGYWHEIRPDHGEEYDIVDDCATYIDGFCYWIAERKVYPHEIIVSFDLTYEELSTITLPGGHTLMDSSFTLAAFEGAVLGVVIYVRLEYFKLVFPWVLVESKDGHSSQWIAEKGFKVRVEAERPLGYYRNGELLLLEGYDRKLLVYDYVVKELSKIDNCYDYPHTMQLFPDYVDSVVSFDTNTWARPSRPQATLAWPSHLLKRKMKLLKRKRKMLKSRKSD